MLYGVPSARPPDENSKYEYWNTSFCMFARSRSWQKQITPNRAAPHRSCGGGSFRQCSRVVPTKKYQLLRSMYKIQVYGSFGHFFTCAPTLLFLLFSTERLLSCAGMLTMHPRALARQLLAWHLSPRALGLCASLSRAERTQNRGDITLLL